jgi:hypothetical protein
MISYMGLRVLANTCQASADFATNTSLIRRNQEIHLPA